MIMSPLNHFLTLASFLIFTLAAYGVIGIIFNARDISPPKVFHGEWPLNEKPVIVVLMITQAGLVGAGIFGLIGVIRRSLILFYCPGFIYLGIFATLSIFGGNCIRESQRDISHEIFQAVQKNANNTGEYFDWISEVQFEYECCGVKSYMDWNLFQFRDIPQDSVPYTCCIRDLQVPPKDCGNGVLTPNRARAEIAAKIFAKGCGPNISSLQSQTLLWKGIEMLIIGVLSLLVAGFLYFRVTSLMHLGQAEGTHENTEDNESRERAESDSDNYRPPFSGNRRQGRNSSVSFAEDVGNNNPVDRRVPRFRSTSRNRAPKTIRRHAGSGAGSKVRTARHCERKIAHQQHHSRKLCNPALLEAEMLFQLRDNHSTLSTTPYPSDAHSFINYFHQAKTTASGKESKVEPSGHSDLNLSRERERSSTRHSTLRALSHYSSLPQVYLVTPSASPPPDQRSRVMAELRQRLPPTLKNPGIYKLKSDTHGQPQVHAPTVAPLLAMPLSSPNQALHTQHHHYYRIPSPSMSNSSQTTEPISMSIPDPHPPPNISVCPTIPEEDESPLVKTVTFRESVSEIGSTLDASSQTMLSFRSEGSETFIRPTVFEVFGTESEPAVMQTEREFLAGSSTTSVAAQDETGLVVTPIQIQVEIPSEGTTCLQDSLMETNEGKIEPEPIDAMLYFNV